VVNIIDKIIKDKEFQKQFVTVDKIDQKFRNKMIKLLKNKTMIRIIDILYNSLLKCVKGTEQKSVRRLFYKDNSHYRYLVIDN